jgi:hypothetical protein
MFLTRLDAWLLYKSYIYRRNKAFKSDFCLHACQFIFPKFMSMSSKFSPMQMKTNVHVAGVYGVESEEVSLSVTI